MPEAVKDEKQVLDYEYTFDMLDYMDGVFNVSLVDYPAIERDFVRLKKAESKPQFQVSQAEYAKKLTRFAQDKTRYELTGPLMIPNQRIYRADYEGEYNMWFSASTVQKAQQKFMRELATGELNQLGGSVSHMHAKRLGDNAYVFESWLVANPETDKSKALGLPEMPIGTWMLSVKVNSIEYWQEYIESGKVQGFSLEGYFQSKDEEKKNWDRADLNENEDIQSQMQAADEREEQRAKLAKIKSQIESKVKKQKAPKQASKKNKAGAARQRELIAHSKQKQMKNNKSWLSKLKDVFALAEQELAEDKTKMMGYVKDRDDNMIEVDPGMEVYNEEGDLMGILEIVEMGDEEEMKSPDETTEPVSSAGDVTTYRASEKETQNKTEKRLNNIDARFDNLETGILEIAKAVKMQSSETEEQKQERIRNAEEAKLKKLQAELEATQHKLEKVGAGRISETLKTHRPKDGERFSPSTKSVQKRADDHMKFTEQVQQQLKKAPRHRASTQA